MKRKSIMKITETGILSAISTILYLPMFSFPLPFLFPGFLEIQFSNLPAIIAGFASGPIAGCIIIVVKTILKLFITGSSTSYVGELADLIIGLLVVLTTSLIYQKKKTKKQALISLGCGSLVWVMSGVLANWLILVPFYIELFMGGNVEIFVSACSIIPGINESNYMIMYLIFGALFFNMLLVINGSFRILFNTSFVENRIAVTAVKISYRKILDLTHIMQYWHRLSGMVFACNIVKYHAVDKRIFVYADNLLRNSFFPSVPSFDGKGFYNGQ